MCLHLVFLTLSSLLLRQLMCTSLSHISLPLRFPLISRWIEFQIAVQNSFYLFQRQILRDSSYFTGSPCSLQSLLHPSPSFLMSCCFAQLTEIPPVKQSCCLFQRLTPTLLSPTWLQKNLPDAASPPPPSSSGNATRATREKPLCRCSQLCTGHHFFYKYPKINVSKFRGV